jgi:pimeloyl-ACP methyl ester carboxylesterase
MTDWDDFAVHRIGTGDANLAVSGGGDGPPVLLRHGFPQHSRVWRRIAPVLAERFTVIVPDQRGIGASSIPAGGFTKTNMARDLAAVLDALGHDYSSIDGCDLGAGVAVAFARDHPERTERLAVMEFVMAGFGLEQAMAPKKGRCRALVSGEKLGPEPRAPSSVSLLPSNRRQFHDYSGR